LILADPDAGPRVGLVTRDLLVRARVGAALGECARGLQLLGDDARWAGFDLLLIDLNRDARERLVQLRTATQGRPGADVFCFGPHTEMRELSPAARAAGASRCVANSHLPESLRRWLRSWELAGAAGRATG